MDHFVKQMPPVYNELVLHLTKQRILIAASDVDNEYLTIDRNSCEVTHFKLTLPNHPIWECDTRRVHGLLGIIQFPSGPHLLVVTDRVLIGTLGKKKIFRLNAVELIPVASDNRDRKQDDYCRQTVLDLLQKPFFYFSYDYYLTHSMQRISQLSRHADEFETWISTYEDADHRFVWNDALLRDWYQPEMRSFCLPLMHGYISINMLDPVLCPRLRDHGPLGLVLISRCSAERAGVRFFNRGIDAKGHVANFVETEQIVVYGDSYISYVQTRGSIPLFWTQTPNLRFRPRPQLESNANHLNACRQHLIDQCAKYGKLLLVDLVDRTVEAEADLSNAYESIAKQSFNRDVVYARKGLFEQVDSDYLNGFKGSIVGMHPLVQGDRKQDRVIRTNCIDCIDETNVFQSRVAMRACAKALFELGIAPDSNDPLIIIFKRLCGTVWINNANVLSVQYTGSLALKLDLTFRQSNSIEGCLRDLITKVKRYFYNNFFDGGRQDAIDFFLRVQPRRAPRIFPEPPPFLKSIYWVVLVFSLILSGIPLCVHQSYEQVMEETKFRFTAFMIFTFVYLFKNFPHMLVDMPQLEYRWLEAALEDDE